ncbi:MAG TPA: hypothetical protein DHK64_06265, partial [Rhodobiaceae bacterium]|nr:hypothetical protein [Rhodobiaceae bacterium]
MDASSNARVNILSKSELLASQAQFMGCPGNGLAPEFAGSDGISQYEDERRVRRQSSNGMRQPIQAGPNVDFIWLAHACEDENRRRS